MLSSFRLHNSVLPNSSCCKQQLSGNPAGKAVTSLATVPAAGDRLSKEQVTVSCLGESAKGAVTVV